MKRRKSNKSITKNKLYKLMTKADGDIDFFLFLLDQYWSKNE